MILVSNDDGIHSEGLRARRNAMAALDEVVEAAPDRERSAVSHSPTLAAVAGGAASVTPIHLDLTNHECRERLSSLDLPWP